MSSQIASARILILRALSAARNLEQTLGLEIDTSSS
jgi:hypothetical protein